MNVKKCFALFLAMLGVSVSFAFVFSVRSFANYEEDETVIEDVEEEMEDTEFPLLTSELPSTDYVTQEVYQENMTNLFNLINNKIPVLTVVKEVDYRNFPTDIMTPESLSSVYGVNELFDEMLDYAFEEDAEFYSRTYTYSTESYSLFPSGYYRISNYDNDLVFAFIFSQNDDMSIIPILEYEYFDIYLPYDTFITFVSFYDYDYHIQVLDNCLSVGGSVFDNMSNKLDILQTDMYLLKNSVCVIGFTLLFSVMYPLLTSITHKFMGRKD